MGSKTSTAKAPFPAPATGTGTEVRTGRVELPKDREAVKRERPERAGGGWKLRQLGLRGPGNRGRRGGDPEAEAN